MASVWKNVKITYHVGKCMGLFPFSGRREHCSALYSSALWISLGALSISVGLYDHYYYTGNIRLKRKHLMSVKAFKMFFKFLVAVLSVLFSAQRSKRFFALIGDFQRFDSCTLRTECPANPMSQTLYLSYALAVEVYYLLISLFHDPETNVIILFTWTMVSASIMLMIIQFTAFVNVLRQRYASANSVFSNSINSDRAFTRRMYPKEIANMYIQLRDLTEEAKRYYAYHVILIILDSVLVFVLCVTSLTTNYTFKKKSTLLYNELLFVYCILKLLFLFFVVRETHNTVQEARKAVLIAHEALSVTTIPSVSKELEVLIMTTWNHPIKFDVYGFFELDYELLQTIIASMVTYVVVLVQIQLVIYDG